MKRVPPATSGDTRAEQIENAPSFEELEKMRPPWDEHFVGTPPYPTSVNRDTKYPVNFEGGDDVIRWYNTAPYTAAKLFVEAAEQSDEFREAFVSKETEQKPAFPEEDESRLVEVDVWRRVMKEECPELHEKLNSIGLSAFQGGAAEQMARKVL